MYVGLETAIRNTTPLEGETLIEVIESILGIWGDVDLEEGNTHAAIKRVIYDPKRKKKAEEMLKGLEVMTGMDKYIKHLQETI